MTKPYIPFAILLSLFAISLIGCSDCVSDLECELGETCASGLCASNTASFDGNDEAAIANEPSFSEICQDEGHWYDSARALCWENRESPETDWSSALSYCNGLREEGLDTWRLPSIEELESLKCRPILAGINAPPSQPSDDDEGIFGCGSCSRPEEDPVGGSSISNSTSSGMGSMTVTPEDDGTPACMWNNSLDGACDRPHWSSTGQRDAGTSLGVSFQNGETLSLENESLNFVRCVHLEF